MSKSSKYHQFFPYNTYRLGQEELIRKIEEGTRLKNNRKKLLKKK